MSQRKRPVPGPGEPIQLRLHSVPKLGKERVRFLGDYTGLLAHWKNNVSLPCPGTDRGQCKVHGLMTTWQGFAPAEFYRGGQFRDWVPCVQEISDRFRQLLGTEPLRGQVWDLYRAVGEHGRVECTGDFVEQLDPTLLRECFDCRPVVQVAKRTTLIMFDVLPELPDRIYMRPTPAGPSAPIIVTAAADAQVSADDAARAAEMLRAARAKVLSANGTSEQPAR